MMLPHVLNDQKTPPYDRDDQAKIIGIVESEDSVRETIWQEYLPILFFIVFLDRLLFRAYQLIRFQRKNQTVTCFQVETVIE